MNAPEPVTASLIGGALDGQERQIASGLRRYLEPVLQADLDRFERAAGTTFADSYVYEGEAGGDVFYRYAGRIPA